MTNDNRLFGKEGQEISSSYGGTGHHLYASSLISRALRLVRLYGFKYFIRKSFTFAGRIIYARTMLKHRDPGNFHYRNVTYSYFFHPYNFTWDNERTVEIPIALEIINRYKGKRILEVGNVLSHYITPEWVVIDKFEKASCVTCADAVDFRPSEPYDLILSVSTLEHVGFDDDIRDPALIPRAIENLRTHCLTQDGILVITIPVGYNPPLDDLLFGGKLGETGVWFMKRMSRYAWIEVTADEVAGTGYATDYIEAGALAVIEFSSLTKHQDQEHVSNDRTKI